MGAILLHSDSQLLFRILLAQLSLQLCGDGGKHPAERQSNFFAGLAFSCILFTIQFTIWLQKRVPCHKEVVCVQDRGITSGLWMQERLTRELQPKGAVAARIVRSSGKENSPKESFSCLVVARAHSLSTSTTGAEQDRKEVRSARHLCKTGQGDPLCVHHRSTSGSMENQGLRGADRIKNTGCRCIYYVN